MSERVDVNPGYVLAQLERALTTSLSHADPAVRARSRERVARWERVLTGMRDGALAIGSRTPTAAPAWATLEVAHGGFATGALRAGGAILEHEVSLAETAGVPAQRLALNLHYVSDAGRASLMESLASGQYHVDVPEEGALLATAALIASGNALAASKILDAITPFFDRLRFYPIPSARKTTSGSRVHCETVSATRARIAALDTPPAVAAMNESLAIWAPLADRVVALFLETVEGETPRLVTAHDGALVRDARGQPRVVGGWPCRRYPETFRARARTILDDAAHARRSSSASTKPENKKRQDVHLRTFLARAAGEPATLTPAEIGRIRAMLAAHVSKHGVPGSPENVALRASQAATAARPTRRHLAGIVADRLAHVPADEGLAELTPVLASVTPEEAARWNVPEGSPLERSWTRRLQRCLDASVDELVERGVLTSGEALARVLPQVSSHVRALAFDDASVALLYAQVDAAFRRRRSLLLLDYQRQVRLEELPWIAQLATLRASESTNARSAARRMLGEVALLAITSFPFAIIPSPLLNELRALARAAETELPLVDELAADIFMGGFTAKFVRAASIAGSLLEGSLYARYYAIDFGEVRAIERSLAADGGPVPAFGALCARRAVQDSARSIVQNGRRIEQQQILTTQNLAVLISGLDLRPLLTPRIGELVDRSFAWMLRRLQTKPPQYIDRLRAAKNAAFAWRQLISLLALCDDEEIAAFVDRARTKLDATREPLRSRFAPYLDGIRAAAQGETLALHDPRRLLGWHAGTHPLLADESSERRR